ncbi:T9SS type A sorting domain-containing protein [Aequorivita xiaoshiensis]|uniref:T9SS type A sorting domain-containing protein n=1 Tax=Aequorivita xiaoshiensis TaxID=2874476 RepID=A0A9X1U6P4_9FLAO|nr:T9SS type A sorting domain-containing protein [Aequorivita xiaoshiensis]MCG2431818.1 T9SS type A sorting domain-containing protein [Aequorivita xiaoshiensis]
MTTCWLQSQSYAPAAGQVGSTAIAADSGLFVSWATGVSIERGYVDISNPDYQANGSNFTTYGEPDNAIGPATNSAVSLGDGGQAILTFDKPIKDGPGFDFAVFENSFSDFYLELAFVEVSSNGIDFFRFPSHSQTQTEIQVEGFDELDPTYINNLAGKYRAMFGTPFDLSELQDDPLLDKGTITHIKIIDVVGSLDINYASYDSHGNIINDPFTTPFHSGGFDLDAVGVIHEQVLGIDEIDKVLIQLYPNPVTTQLFIRQSTSSQAEVYDLGGRLVYSKNLHKEDFLDVSNLQDGLYVLVLLSSDKISQYRFLKR